MSDEQETQDPVTAAYRRGVADERSRNLHFPKPDKSYAAGVAAERVRCLAIVKEVEGRRDHGAAINACRDIAEAIREGK